MVLPISPIDLPNAPTSQVTPFTHRDGMTYLQRIERIKKFLDLSVIPHINNSYKELADAFTSHVNDLIEHINTNLSEQTAENDEKINNLEEFVSTLSTNLQSAINNQISDQTNYVNNEIDLLKTFVNTSVDSIINSTIEVSDPVVFGIFSDSTNKSRGYVNAYNVTSKSTTSTPESLTVAQIQSAIDEAALQKLPVVFPPGIYNINKNINIPSNTHLICEPGAVFDVSNGTYATGSGVLHSSGTLGTFYGMPIDTMQGATTVQLPVDLASSIMPGDIIVLRSEEAAFTADYRAGEMHLVISKTGFVATLESPVKLNYSLADSGRVAKMTPVHDIKIEGARFTSQNPTSAPAARGIAINFGQRITINDTTFDNATGGIYLNSVIDGTVNNVFASRLPNLNNFQGYAVTVSGVSANIIVDNLHARYLRHAFTTLGGSAEEIAGVSYGGPRDIIVSNGISEGGEDIYSHWDTHPQGIDITFDNCHAYGGTGANANGFQIRSRRTTLKNCKSLYVGARGVSAGSSRDLIIQGGEFGFGGVTQGVGGVALGNKSRVQGAYIHDNAGAGISPGLNSHVQGCIITGNTYGVQDTSTPSNIVFIDNFVPGGTNVDGGRVQNVSFLSPKAGTIIVDNKFLGYGDLLDGIGGTIDPAAVIRSNHVDKGRYSLGSLIIDPGNASQASAIIQRWAGVANWSIRRASGTDDAVLQINTDRKFSVLGGTFEFLATTLAITSGTNVSINTTSSAPPAGTAGDVPTKPTGWMNIQINGVNCRMPYWAV